jgi:hypothetical protein
MNPMDRFYAIQRFKAKTPTFDIVLYLVAVLALIVIGATA